MKLNPLEKLAVMALFTLGFCRCGAGAPASLIDGEWDFAISGASCTNGGNPGGKLVIYEGAAGALTGEYDLCGRRLAYTDLAGRVRGQRFELFLLNGSVNVVNGSVAGDGLSGDVVGLGDGVAFTATRSGARTGKMPKDQP